MSELAPGVVVAGMRIESVAGRGGMGVVYRAVDLALGRPVALKVLAPGLLEDSSARERFLRESRAVAAIDHPNVVPIYSAGEHDGTVYLAMRFVGGDDLRDRVACDGPLSPRAAARVVAQVAAALDAAHAAGLVHRDVKPANILLADGDHVYLGDFGVARHVLSEGGLTRTGGLVGTLDWVAPEQIRGERVDGRADVYALGCVLHFALTGAVPFPRESDESRLWAHVHAAPPVPSREGTGVPPAFDAVVRRALAKRPEERFQSAGELGRAALAAAGEAVTAPAGRTDGSTTAASADPPRARRRGRPSAVLAGTALVAAALSAAAVALLTGGGDGERGADREPVRAPAPASGPKLRVAKTFRTGRRPIAVRLAGGNAWVASTRADRLTRVDIGDARRRPGPVVGRRPSDLTDRRGVLWVAVAGDARVVRLDARTGRPAAPPIAVEGEPRSIDWGQGAVWVGEVRPEGADTLAQLDPRTGEVLSRTPVPEGINDVRAAAGAVWVVGRHAEVLLKINPISRVVERRFRVGRKPLRVAFAAGDLWVTNHDDDTVTRVDPVTRRVVTIAVGSKPYGIAPADGAVWVASYGDQTLARLDPRSSRMVGARVPVGLNPIGVAVDRRSVWATSAVEDSVARVDLPRGRAG